MSNYALILHYTIYQKLCHYKKKASNLQLQEQGKELLKEREREWFGLYNNNLVIRIVGMVKVN